MPHLTFSLFAMVAPVFSCGGKAIVSNANRYRRGHALDGNRHLRAGMRANGPWRSAPTQAAQSGRPITLAGTLGNWPQARPAC